MNYINTDRSVSSAQGVPKRPRKFKDFEQLSGLADVQTQKRARPPHMNTKNKISLVSLQPLQRILILLYLVAEI